MAGFSITQLAELLQTGGEGNDECALDKTCYSSKINPSDIGARQKASSASGNVEKVSGQSLKTNKGIWDENEIESANVEADEDDVRQQPEYDILYKQSLSADDTFLGLTRKDQSTACCECLLIKISLPGVERLADITLDVQPQALTCNTSSWYLGLHLPHKVKSKSGKASWDGSKCLLTVELPLEREYDFINLS